MFIYSGFVKSNATIIRTLFFQSTRTDQNSSSKVLQNFMVSNWIILPSELNQKSFSFFPRNTQYRTRLKGPPFSFFGVVRFFSIFFLRGSPIQFFDVLQQRMLKNPKGSPLLACQFDPIFELFGYCKRKYLTLWSPFAIFELYIWCRFGPFPACFYKWDQLSEISAKWPAFSCSAFIRSNIG